MKKEEFYAKLHEAEKLLRLLAQQQKEDFTFDWIDQSIVMKLLNICGKTVRNWQDSGMLHYSEIGGKRYYKLSAIREYLEENYTGNNNNNKKKNKGMNKEE